MKHQCPSGDFGCPHYNYDGETETCELEDPAHECDDYMYYMGCEDEEEEEDEDEYEEAAGLLETEICQYRLIVGLDDKAIAHLISVDWTPGQMRIVSGVLMERGESGVAEALAALADGAE